MNILDRAIYRLAEWRARAGGGFHVSQEPPGWVALSSRWLSDAGIAVTPELALNVSTVFACVRVLAEGEASLPLITYRRLADRRKERASDIPLYRVLHSLPNPEMTSIELRETLMGHVLTWGNAYCEIELTRGGDVRALWPLRPDRMTPKRENGEVVFNYKLPQPDSRGRTERTFARDLIFRIHGIGFDGLNGYSPVGMARESIGLSMATEKLGNKFFANGARPGGVLEHPGKLNDISYKRLKESWEARHQGLENASRIAILEEGLKYHDVGMPLDDAQFLQTRRFQVEEIARWYRVPLHMVGDLERATFSNIEHLGLEFVTYSLTPWLVRWEQAIARDLMTEQERQTLYAEHLVDGLLRGDIKSRYEAYSVGRQNGWLNADDIRSLENMNPLPDGQGEIYLVPLNMIPASQVGGDTYSESDPSQEATPENIESSAGLNGAQINAAIDVLNGVIAGTVAATVAEELLVSLGIEAMKAKKMVADTVNGNLAASDEARSMSEMELRRDEQRAEQRAAQAVQLRHRLQGAWFGTYQDVAARTLKREVQDVGAAARKFLAHNDYASFSLWLEEFYRDHIGFVIRQFAPVTQSYGELVAGAVADEIGSALWDDPQAQEWVTAYLDAFAARHCGISEARVRNAARTEIDAGGDPLPAIEGELETWPDKRATDTARWESVRFNNALSVGLYLIAGREFLRWHTFGENCPYCSSLDGKISGINSFFVDAGDFQPEGAERPLNVSSSYRHAPIHDGCDCMVSSR